MEYDYIIIGGGSSGAVIASRLSEDPAVSVLLLEAGAVSHPLRSLPASYALLIDHPVANWRYRSTPETGTHGRVIPVPRGKLLGGSSAINGLVYVRGQAQDYVALYFSRYPGVRDFMERMRQQAREQGYVETLFGRRLYLNDINARNQGLRAGAERAAINAPMQGTAADIIKKAMVKVDTWLRESAAPAKMILQVHDELVFECEAGYIDELRTEVVKHMSQAAQLRVPLVVDTGHGLNWDEAH